MEIFQKGSYTPHEQNIIDNLGLAADLGYASIRYVRHEDAGWRVCASYRTTTAIGPEMKATVGTLIADEQGASDIPEVEEALAGLAPVRGAVLHAVAQSAPAITVHFYTSVFPIYNDTKDCVGFLICDRAAGQAENPGRMESEFERMADELCLLLCRGMLHDAQGNPFSTDRRPGDGVLRVNAQGMVVYPSPNAVAIMRMAGYESRVRTSHAAELPGGGYAIMNTVGHNCATSREVDVADRRLLYRSIDLGDDTLVLVEDITALRAEQRAVRIKEATIREVHHRVKNNLQTVAALLRMQARRSDEPAVKKALSEATQRIDALAVVHRLLSGSPSEELELGALCDALADALTQAFGQSRATVTISGIRPLLLSARRGTTVAMVVAELLQNAFEHGAKAGQSELAIQVNFSLVDEDVLLVIADNGCGLPEGFDLDKDAHLGLGIVETLVTQDLGGTLKMGNHLHAPECAHGAVESTDGGATFWVRLPRIAKEEGSSCAS